MRVAPLLLLLIGCATAPPPSLNQAAAPAAAPDPQRDARAAAHLSGLGARITSLANLPEIVSRSIRAAALRAGVDPEVSGALTELRAAAARTHDSEAIRVHADDALFELDKKRQSRAAADYLASDAHQRVREQQNRVLTPVGQKALGAFLATLPATPPDPERLARARALVQSSREVDLVVSLSYDASRAFLELVLDNVVEDKRDKLAPLLKPRPNERATFRAKVERSLVLQTYFATRYVEDKHVIRELAFWRSSVGQWLSVSRLRAVRMASERCNADLRRALAPKRDPAPKPPADRR